MAKILFVDDSEGQRRWMQSYIDEQSKHTVVMAKDYRSAVHLLTNQDFDLVITDYGFGFVDENYKAEGRSGLDLARWINENKPDLPVLLQTGSEEIIERAKAGEYSCLIVGMLDKPEDAGLFCYMQAINNALSNRRNKPMVR